MKNRRLWTSLFFVLPLFAVVALAYYARQKNNTEMNFSVEDAPDVQATVISDSDAETQGIDDYNEPPPAEIADKDLEPVIQWVKEEAKVVDHSKVNLQERENTIVEKVRSFSARQLAQLQKISQDPKAPMGERILSTYMLGKNDASRDNLIGLASRENPVKDFAPHSADEINHNKEQAVRVMAVDAIATRQDTVENRLRDLQTIISQSGDIFIKKYAQQKIDQLNR